MERQAVSSSNIVSVGYDAGSETLEVEFQKSGLYQYFNVPVFIYERLLAADSIGKFINAEIKNTYPFAKV
jgi:hypothetical protein